MSNSWNGGKFMYHKARMFSLSMLLFITLVAASVESTSAISWSAHIEQLTTYIQFDGLPSITQTSDGRIWVVWSRAVYGYRALFYKTSSDMGKTWSEETNLTEVPSEYENTKPSITQTTDGKTWIAWASNMPPPPPPPEPDFNITASPKSLTIPQNGSDTSTITVTSVNNFSEPVELWVFFEPENVTTTLNPPEVTPPPNGTANSTLTVSVGPTATPGNYTLTVTGKSTTSHTVNIALEITQLSGLSYSSSSLSPSPLSSEDYEIYYRTSSDNGATWSDIVELTENTVNDLGPSIIQAANGTIFIVWQSIITGNDELFYKTSSDSGASWSDGRQLTDDPDSDTSPSITQTKDGKIWVTWSSCRTGYFEIFYKTYDGSSWSNDTRLTESLNIDSSPSILQTEDQTIWIFWTSGEETETATNDIYYKYSTDGGDNWSDRIQFTTDENEDMWSSTTQTSDLKIWGVWTSNRTGNYDIFYRTSLVGDITGPEDPPDSGEYPPDGTVDIYDLAFVAEAYGKEEGDPYWEEYSIADITGPEKPPDGFINIYDLAIVAKNYGET